MPQIFRPIRTLLGLLLRRPILGTSIIPVMPDGKIVLIRRRDTGKWGLPGGIVDWGEDIPEAAARELIEETGLTMLAVERLVGIYSDTERDPRFHSVCVALSARVEGTFKIQDVADVLAVQSCQVTDLPNG